MPTHPHATTSRSTSLSSGSASWAIQSWSATHPILRVTATHLDILELERSVLLCERRQQEVGMRREEAEVGTWTHPRVRRLESSSERDMTSRDGSEAVCRSSTLSSSSRLAHPHIPARAMILRWRLVERDEAPESQSEATRRAGGRNADVGNVRSSSAVTETEQSDPLEASKRRIEMKHELQGQELAVVQLSLGARACRRNVSTHRKAEQATKAISNYRGHPTAATP